MGANVRVCILQNALPMNRERVRAHALIRLLARSPVWLFVRSIVRAAHIQQMYTAE